jgi:hypothetical protein
MKRDLLWYYVTRGLIILAWVGVMVLLQAPSGTILLGALLMVAFYMWLPRSGRYVIQGDRPFAPLRRDEREQIISFRATSYAFAVLVALLAAVVLGADLRGQETLSADLVGITIGLGLAVWFAANVWLRRRM